MRKVTYTFASLVVGLLLGVGTLPTLAHGQGRGETKATIGNASVSIEYGRPSLQGREPMKLMPAGSVWRLGANDATTITSDADLDFGGMRVAKGKHILLARLAEGGKWSLMVSSKGAMQYDAGAKLGEVPLELQEGKDSVEDLTITLTNKGGKGVVEIAWGTSRLVGSFAPAK